MIISKCINFFRKKDKTEEILKQNWGKPKEGYFETPLIKEYFEWNEIESDSFLITDKVANDLDFNAFFQFIDRTTSAIGQQYLYNKVRRINCSEDSLLSLEKEVIYFDENIDKRIAAQKHLSTLLSGNDYYFPFLIYGALPPKLSFIKWIKLLQILTLATILACFINKIFVFGVMLLVAVNMGLHYWHKKRIGQFAHIFYRLNSLTKTARKLIPIGAKIEREGLLHSLEEVEKTTAQIFLLKTEELAESEIGAGVWFIFEVIKIITLSEILTFDKILERIKKYRPDIKNIFEFIGATDVAISIGSLRAGLPYYCNPTFLTDKKELNFEALYHPIITDCVANDLHLKDKSLLLTGSNMSGKSTFVKAINLNVIAAQTMNTCFAKTFKAPVFAISTSIKIEDDIEMSKSYYLAEVVSIGEMINKSESTIPQFLFTIDEVFKGTNTIERVSAAKAILSYLNQNNHLVLVSTHDIELTNFLNETYDLYFFQENVEGKGLSFDYKLKRGELKEKNAIKILEISGYPKSVVEEAKLLAGRLEQEKQ